MEFKSVKDASYLNVFLHFVYNGFSFIRELIFTYFPDEDIL